MSRYRDYYANPYTAHKSEAWHVDGGGNDEYYTAYCSGCGKVTEHDICTDECVEC